MKEKELVKLDPSKQMEELYREVNEYSLEKNVKKRKRKKVINIILDCFLVFFLSIIISIGLMVSITKESNEVPIFFSYSIQYVQTESMDPTLPAGSIILSKAFNHKDPSKTPIKVGYKNSAQEGDILTFKDKDGLIITHRAVASFVDTRGKIYYETKGDNNKTIDPNPLPEENIITIFVKRIL